MTELYKINTNCRLCGGKPDELLDLGNQPPANALLHSPDAPEDLIPLVLMRCPACHAVQITVDVNPEELFRRYVWVTGTSETARKHSERFCREALDRVNNPDPFVLEIASNDGTFLRDFREKGLKVLGVDPAENIAEMARRNGIPTLAEFWGEATAEMVMESHGKADLVFARNVFPHVANILDFARGLTRVVKPDGVVALEFHDAGVILRELHYDSIYHEHLFYFSVQVVENLLNRFGLFAFDFITSPISGGSNILFFSPDNTREASDTLQHKRQEELRSGVNTAEAWKEFSEKAVSHAECLRQAVVEHARSGRQIIGYGASARSSTLLNFAGIDRKMVRCIADANPLKHGTYTPGTRIPIVEPHKAMEGQPDTVILLAWNFERELLSIIRDQLGFRGSIIVPLPGDVRILPAMGGER